MPTEDETRRELFDLLETGIGSRGAALLMTYLPSTGWADLATRQQVDAVAADLRGEMRAQLPKLIAANIASMIGLAGLVLAAGAIS